MTPLNVAIALLISFAAYANDSSRVADIEKQVREDFSSVTRVEVSSPYLEKGAAVPEDADLEILSPRPALGWISFRYRWGNQGTEMIRKGTALVRVYDTVAVTKKPVRHGESLSSLNVEFEEREISPFRQSGYYETLEKVEGLQARGHLATGVVIGFRQTAEVAMVERGQSVELVNRRGNVKVSVKVIALESGRLNQWIKVENASSRKKLMAKITAPGTASLQ